MTSGNGDRPAETGLLAGKRLVVTGVLTTTSLAFHVARVAQEQGAEVVVTGYGRLSLVERVAARLPVPPPVIELDVTDPEHLARLRERVGEHWDAVDGVVHAIAFAPPAALGGGFLSTGWGDVATAVQVSAYSLVAVTTALADLFGDTGASVVGLDFDATRAWPGYDWMGVAKAGLESCARYLACYLGERRVRVNLVAAGPVRTMAATAVPSFAGFESRWSERAPLGWSVDDPEPVALACVALLSDLFPATTGEIVHVDGGAHAVDR